MQTSNVVCAILFIVCAFIQCAHNLDYSDLEAQGVPCPNLEDRYKCNGFTSRLEYGERGCECDEACNTYKDCCINAPRRRTSGRRASRNRWTCLNVGEKPEAGVFVISTCPVNTPRTSEIRQKCEGAVDFSDPLIAAPVTDSNHLTYKNRYCAECNNAHMANLTTFHLKLSCPGSEFLTDEQIYADLKYSSQLGVWGLERMNSRNTTDFIQCTLMFDVPSYLNNIARSCHSNVISNCPPTYSRDLIKEACESYMAVMYDRHNSSYRNPHCAICNGKNVNDLFCQLAVFGRGRPMSFALLLDVNPSDGDEVGMRQVSTPSCPSNHIYDPFKKACRKLVCALPGYNVVDGRCVRG